MTLEEAMRTRHTVRRYTEKKIPQDLLARLDERMRGSNERRGLAMSLVTENTEAFGPALKLFFAKGVRNYLILAGPDRPGLDEAVGYCGADMMLFAQTLGLNSWWVGGTYSRKGVERNAAPGAGKILGLIALGYGRTQGVPHRSKRPEEVTSYAGPAGVVRQGGGGPFAGAHGAEPAGIHRPGRGAEGLHNLRRRVLRRGSWHREVPL